MLSTNLGNLYMAMGKVSKAIECFEIAYEKDPKHVNNSFGNSLSRYLKDKAIETFKKVLELDQTKESARYHLARIFVNLESYEEAIEHFHKTNFGLSKKPSTGMSILLR